jgi:long-chain acyl-CoA synthetase
MGTTVRTRLAQLLRQAPADAEAVGFEGRWWTWGQLRTATVSIDEALTSAGVGPAGRVGVVLENRPEQVCVLLSAFSCRSWPRTGAWSR